MAQVAPEPSGRWRRRSGAAGTCVGHVVRRGVESPGFVPAGTGRVTITDPPSASTRTDASPPDVTRVRGRSPVPARFPQPVHPHRADPVEGPLGLFGGEAGPVVVDPQRRRRGTLGRVSRQFDDRAAVGEASRAFEMRLSRICSIAPFTASAHPALPQHRERDAAFLGGRRPGTHSLGGSGIQVNGTGSRCRTRSTPSRAIRRPAH